MISETTLNQSLEPVKTIKINPSVSTVTVSNTLARFYVKIRFRFRVKPGVLHNTGACRKCAVNKVTYNYRGGRKRSFRTSNRKERLILIGPRTGYPTKTTFLYFNHISVTFFLLKITWNPRKSPHFFEQKLWFFINELTPIMILPS